METEENNRLSDFEHEGQRTAVQFEATVDVAEGVQCDVYTFIDDPSKDLGVIRVNKGFNTPLQRVLQGDRTIEGYISGKGRLVVTRVSNEVEMYEFGDQPQEHPPIDIRIGDLMQWHASEDLPLVVYEICFPPYQEGRYENIE